MFYSLVRDWDNSDIRAINSSQDLNYCPHFYKVSKKFSLMAEGYVHLV